MGTQTSIPLDPLEVPPIQGQAVRNELDVPLDTVDELVRLVDDEESLLVELDDEAHFDTLRTELRAILQTHGRGLEGRQAKLDLGLRRIDLFDLRRLEHLLRDDFGIHVTGIFCTHASLLRYTEQELKLRVHLKASEALVPEEDQEIEGAEVEATPVEVEAIEVEEVTEPDPVRGARGASEGPHRRVQVVERTVRSGARVRFDGDVLVYGDVNAGAQVIAGGNVTVLGVLRGTAHAGSEGDEMAQIMALDLQAEQLRIAHLLALPGANGELGGATREIESIEVES
ncbi:MAG: septum site-determining protein MinC, partial [Myxococcota bacterium]|nr:septum site-determining protein MinC [Myxococcota bacterium]